MSNSQLISLGSVVMTLFFAWLVLLRWAARPRPHLAMWGSGLVLYAVAALGQLLLSFGWNAFWFKLWYWTGAVLVAPWIGQGTVFLLVRRKSWAWASLGLVIALGAAALLLIWPAQTNPAAFSPQVDLTHQYRAIFVMTGAAQAARQILVILANVYGTLLLCGGALLTAFLLWRKSVLPQRMAGNLCIAAGGLLPALSGTLILLGRPEYKYLGDLLGSLCLFAGFLLATTEKDRIAQARPVAAK